MVPNDTFEKSPDATARRSSTSRTASTKGSKGDADVIQRVTRMSPRGDAGVTLNSTGEHSFVEGGLRTERSNEADAASGTFSRIRPDGGNASGMRQDMIDQPVLVAMSEQGR
jgi:hypothetical protein